MSDITLYHNPVCGTSRQVLEMLRAAGHEPRIVEYLKTPPDRATLARLVAATGEPARALVRDKGPVFEELGLAGARLDDDRWLDLMAQHPALINRPIVVAPAGTRLCRPAARVLDLLPDAAG